MLRIFRQRTRFSDDYQWLRADARWSQQLIANRPSAQARDGTRTGNTSWRSQLGNTTNVSVSGIRSMLGDAISEPVSLGNP